ncbi:MAG: phosphatase PAP2 family protein [Myxococcales bacterium]|nr:phosphatase PAP2 family protein [Myxococcales bacterium]
MTRAFVIAALVLAQAPFAHADRTEPHRAKRALVGAVAIGLIVTSETVAKDALAPDACRWCNVNGLDDRVHGALAWGDAKRAAALSNLAAVALLPASMIGLRVIAANDRPDRWLSLGDDLLAIVEATLYSQLVVQAIKFAAGRQRPYAHDAAPGDLLGSNDDNLSFLSGHSSLSFAIATSAGVVARARGAAYEPVIWATGLTLAATTAYLRIAAEKHYLTDVLAGSALGVTAGLLVPRITGGLPDGVQLVPTGNGLALAGVF